MKKTYGPTGKGIGGPQETSHGGRKSMDANIPVSKSQPAHIAPGVTGPKGPMAPKPTIIFGKKP